MVTDRRVALFSRALVALFLSLAVFCVPAFGEELDARLWEQLGGLEQAQGRFLQELYSEDGELLERSSGRYAVLKPGFFRWEIDYPDRQRIFVVDEQIWHYDMDLATATRRAVRSADEFFAMDLLTSDTASLRERFHVEVLEEGRYRLLPIFPQAGFAAVELGWRDGQLVAMTIRDRSDQQIRLALTPDADAPPLQAQDFSFEPPEGVDVFADSER